MNQAIQAFNLIQVLQHILLIIGFVYLDINQELIDKEIIKINKQISQLKSKLHLTSDYEFKFSRSSNKFRKEFFRIIKKFPIKYKLIIVNKKKLKAPALKYKHKELYCELIRRLFYDNSPPIEKAIFVIDEAVAKIHQKEFKGILRRYLSKNTIKKIQQRRSKTEDMLGMTSLNQNTKLRLRHLICQTILKM
ncbi:MAG: hypothetical protein ABIJ60_02090 [Patescibacteria group bacterium]